MSIVNRRNAVLGWGLWTVVKNVGKKKKSKRKARITANPSKKQAGALTGGLVAVTGALLFWRKKKSSGSPSP